MALTLVKDAIYRIRLTDGSWTDGKFLWQSEPKSHGPRGLYRTNRHFMFENLRTGRTIEIKSFQRIKEVNPVQLAKREELRSA